MHMALYPVHCGPKQRLFIYIIQYTTPKKLSGCFTFPFRISSAHFYPDVNDSSVTGWDLLLRHRDAGTLGRSHEQVWDLQRNTASIKVTRTQCRQFLSPPLNNDLSLYHACSSPSYLTRSPCLLFHTTDAWKRTAWEAESFLVKWSIRPLRLRIYFPISANIPTDFRSWSYPLNADGVGSVQWKL